MVSRGRDKSPTPLKQHLKRHHVMQFEEIQQVKSSDCEVLDEETKKRCILFFNDHQLSFRSIESESFRKFMEVLNVPWRVPCRQTFQEWIEMASRKIKDKLITSLRMWTDTIGLTADACADPAQNAFIGITGQFFNKITKQLEMRVLDLIPCSESETGVEIASKIEEVLRMYGIGTVGTSIKVMGITTDNGSNMLDGVKRLGFPQVNCMAHSLQLCLTGPLFGNSQNGKHPNKGIMLPLVKKFRAYAKKIRKSKTAAGILRDFQTALHRPLLKFLKDVPTRWNSTYTSMQRVEEIGFTIINKWVLEVNKRCSGAHLKELSQEEQHTVTLLVVFLQPFTKMTKFLEGCSNSTLSLVFPLLQKLIKHVRDFDPMNNVLLTKFRTAVESHLQKRFMLNNQLALLATALDPRAKSDTDQLLAPALLRECYRMLETRLLEMHPTLPSPSPARTDSYSLLYSPEKAPPASSRSSIPPMRLARSSLQTELTTYMACRYDGTQPDPFAWWQQQQRNFPTIYNCIPCYSLNPFAIPGVIPVYETGNAI
eukprot:TRINITY_DN3101_c0_g1_i3.p1 TRINITY_DN3101_c0_g1~~TRINITY_DN3101_c0_g1_i3.p1  ORF type:complete len:539 (+),score=60.01 TRINITY_DN3101_c0_g1_i3:235-1851(+)